MTSRRTANARRVGIVLMLSVLVSGCASDPTSATSSASSTGSGTTPVSQGSAQSPSSGDVSGSVTSPAPVLQQDSGWTMSLAAQQLSPADVAKFVALAKQVGIHGEVWEQQVQPAAFAVELDVAGAFNGRAAVVVQMSPVEAAYSATHSTDKGLSQRSTLQWAFDASTGEYLRARSFPASGG